MLNYETILSSYDDKMTLMQWLKKVEEALKHASATAFRVNKKGNATISFILDFEDGTTLESGDIVLQQGESVNGAYIENNHLFITLTNGQVIDSGLLFNGDLTINGTLDATKVTGNEIVEKMNNLSYKIEYSQPTGYTYNIKYYSAVKNGNKLTYVLFGSLTRTSEDAINSINLGKIHYPSSVGTKLIPYSLAGSSENYLDNRKLNLFKSYSSFVEVPTLFQKESNLASNLIAYNVKTAIELNVEYLFRYEITFLLSDNLAGN